MTAVEVVLDASALIRGLQRTTDAASAYMDKIGIGEVAGHVPDLIVPETTNAALRLLRAGAITREEAETLVGVVGDLPLVEHRTADYATAALRFAADTGLSAYDAFYAVLAEAIEAPLVTADRGLAGALARAVLVE